MAGTFTHLVYHLVFSTKKRAPLIVADVTEPLYRYIGGIVRARGGSLLEIGGVEDHVHLLIRLKPTAAFSETVRAIKSSSSKWMREERNCRHFGWQSGYGAFSVSESKVEAVRRYIQRQPEHHRKRSFKEELSALLDSHGIAYDQRYVVD